MAEVFTFLSSDGKTKLHGVRWLPADGNVVGVLQLVHGMVEYIERYDGFATFMTQHGWVVVGHDHLGHGDSASSKDDLGYFCEEDPSGALVEDIHLLRTMTQKAYPNVPYFMLGHSMGSYLLRKYIALHGEGISGAILTGTGHVPTKTSELGLKVVAFLTKLKGSRYRSKLVKNLTFGKSYKNFDMTGTDPDNSWLTKDTEIVKKYYRDPFCTYSFTLNGYRGLMETTLFDCQQENINRIPKMLPVLIASGEDDPVGDLGAGVREVDRMFRAAGIRDVTMKLYRGDRHEILNEADRMQVYSDILGWIEVRM